MVQTVLNLLVWALGYMDKCYDKCWDSDRKWFHQRSHMQENGQNG